MSKSQEKTAFAKAYGDHAENYFNNTAMGQETRKQLKTVAATTWPSKKFIGLKKLFYLNFLFVSDHHIEPRPNTSITETKTAAQNFLMKLCPKRKRGNSYNLKKKGLDF